MLITNAEHLITHLPIKSEMPSVLSELIPCLTMLYTGPIPFMFTVLACECKKQVLTLRMI